MILSDKEMNIPFEYVIWDAEEAAEYFRLSKEYFLRKKRNEPGFPAPVSDDNEKPRWRALDIARYGVKAA